MVLIYKYIVSHLEIAQNIIKKYKNKNRFKRFQLKKRDKIWLKIINLKIKQPNKSLDYKKVGFFKIKEKRGNVNYYFKLLYDVKIYLVFHILLLKKVAN